MDSRCSRASARTTPLREAVVAGNARTICATFLVERSANATYLDEAMPSFGHHGRRIDYTEYGTGSRAIVLVHGLLMDSRMYTKLAPTLAASGHRVIVADMLGHGASAQPHDMTAYSMSQFGRDVIALLDHLELVQAVVGGTSLGANVALEAAVASPQRVRALVLEMPVLEHALPAAAGAFVPLALALRASQRLMSAVAWLT